MRGNRPRNHEDRRRRRRGARKVEARTVFLDAPFCEVVLACCGVCGQRLGWWEKDDDGMWRTQPMRDIDGDMLSHPVLDLGGEVVPPPSNAAFTPADNFRYTYGGYPDTGYEVREVHVTRGQDWRHHRVRTAGGSLLPETLSRGGEAMGRRPRTNDSYLSRPGYAMAMGTIGQVVALPADVYCPTCKTDTLNAIPVPPSGEGAV